MSENTIETKAITYTFDSAQYTTEKLTMLLGLFVGALVTGLGVGSGVGGGVGASVTGLDVTGLELGDLVATPKHSHGIGLVGELVGASVGEFVGDDVGGGVGGGGGGGDGAGTHPSPPAHSHVGALH